MQTSTMDMMHNDMKMQTCLPHAALQTSTHLLFQTCSLVLCSSTHAEPHNDTSEVPSVLKTEEELAGWHWLEGCLPGFHLW